jgi:hypothetical protein
MIPLQVASFSLESTQSRHFPLEETARHHCWLATHRQGDMGHLQHPENNKISIQIYKVVQHCWLATHRKGNMGHLQRLENATRLVNKSTM